MEEQKIERYVTDLLTVSGFSSDGAERRLWALLHHLYCAVALWEQASAEERETVEAMRKKLQYFFSAKISLRERKRKKTENEKLPPTPPIKEKEKPKEIEERTSVRAESEKSSCLDKRREKFRKECLAYVNQYDNNLLRNFFKYWSEDSHHSGKMRFEAERFWNLENRLELWMSNQYSSDIEGAAIRLEKTKKKKTAENTEAIQQKRAAEEREKQQRALEQQAEESRRGSETTAEYTARNPNGILARIERERKAREKNSPIPTLPK